MAILAVHTRKTPLATNVRLEVIVRGIPEFTGADFSNLANEVALLAARKGQDLVVMNDFEIAKDKGFMGNEGRSMIITEEEKRNTAYHESGHAPVAKCIPGTDPIHKVSVIPRGRSMGVTQQLPGNDRHTYSCECIYYNICVRMGGRAAVEIVLGHQTTCAKNDIELSTESTRKMVCVYGMSNLGPLTFGREIGLQWAEVTYGPE